MFSWGGFDLRVIGSLLTTGGNRILCAMSILPKLELFHRTHLRQVFNYSFTDLDLLTT